MSVGSRWRVPKSPSPSLKPKFRKVVTRVTIGFWGAVASLGKIDYLLGAAICGLAGVILMMAVGQWRFRSWSERKQAKKRREALGRIENLNRRIKRLEKELESEAEDLEDLMAKATRRKRVLSPGQDR